ncbi:MAG: fimbrial biogenesis chaperone [Rhodanobacter sp.]
MVLLPRAAPAGSLSVSPTTIEMPARGGVAVLYVVNHGAQPIMAQVEGFDWRQDNGRDRLDASQALQVSPPMARLGPGQTQAVRVLIEPVQANTGERTFRLLISELPDPSSDDGGKVHIFLQFSVPVFAGGPPSAKTQLSWDAILHKGDLRLTVRNDGRSRAKLTDLKLVTPSGKRMEIAPHSLTYILAGADKTWTLRSIGMGNGESFHIEGVNVQTGKILNSTVVAHP